MPSDGSGWSPQDSPPSSSSAAPPVPTSPAQHTLGTRSSSFPLRLVPAGSSKEFSGEGKSLGDPWGSGIHQGRRHSWSISGALPLQVLPQRLPKALSTVRAGQVHLKQQKSSCPAQLRAAVRHRHIPAQSQRLFPDSSRLAFPADSSLQQGQPGWAGEPRAFSQGLLLQGQSRAGHGEPMQGKH